MASNRSTGPILSPFSREYRWSSLGFGHICTVRGKPDVKMEDYRDTVWSQLVDRSHLGHLLHFSSITREFPSISKAFSSVLLAPNVLCFSDDETQKSILVLEFDHADLVMKCWLRRSPCLCRLLRACLVSRRVTGTERGVSSFVL